jgi:hypothetical protein
MMEGCATCSESTCLTSLDGYFIDKTNNVGRRCDSLMQNCLTCNSGTECTKCFEPMTSLENNICVCNQQGNWYNSTNIPG